MQQFTTAQHVEISIQTIEKAREFAAKVIDTVNYSDSNQFQKQKIEFDHFISKIGEEAVVSVFRQFTANVTLPDYAIYQGSRKSWDHDLQIDGVGLAVKTQSQSAAKRFGLSWTFQCGGRRKDPILTMPDGWVCFVQCEDESKFYGCTVYPPRQIKEITFGQPKLQKLIGEKVVVYAKDNSMD